MRLLTITFGNELFLESLSFYFIFGFPMSLKLLHFLIFSFEMVPLLQTVIESLVLEEIPCNQRSLCSSLNLSQCWPGAGINHNPFTQQGFQAATPGLWTAPSLPIFLLYTLQYSLFRTNTLSSGVSLYPWATQTSPALDVFLQTSQQPSMFYFENRHCLVHNQWLGTLKDNH